MANDKVIPKKKTAKHKPPSRVRYEESHPTVSFRISRELYDRLVHIRIEGKSLADILKIGLGMLEPMDCTPMSGQIGLGGSSVVLRYFV